MGEALYRKYRSKSLDEVVGQEHVTSTLAKALSSGKISHAYLLTGPRGVGKTSIARILAHAVNELPYSDQPHLDIIEIDAASNRRIDEIRDIRDKVRISPTSAKYKVYIIDEVHMLTKEAFNALLKTLEEPPKHAIFILATTEAHKLPETIISRTQRFSLRPIDNQVIMKHLSSLAKKEKVSIDNEALELIARQSRGGLRDAISLFDQLSSRSDDIHVEDVEHLLGVAPHETIRTLAENLTSLTPKELLQQLTSLEENGVYAPQLAHQLSEEIQELILSGNIAPQTSLPLLQKLLLVPSAADPHKTLELTLLEYNLASQSTSVTAEVRVQPEIKKTANVSSPQAIKKEVVTPPVKKQPSASSKDLEKIVDEEQWQAILQAVKKRHNTIYGIVRMAQPTLENDELTLCFEFPFHQKRMNDAKNRQLVQDVIAEVTGVNTVLVCTIKAPGKPTAEVKAQEVPQTIPNSGTLDTITDVFGGGEVLES